MKIETQAIQAPGLICPRRGLFVGRASKASSASRVICRVPFSRRMMASRFTPRSAATSSWVPRFWRSILYWAGIILCLAAQPIVALTSIRCAAGRTVANGNLMIAAKIGLRKGPAAITEFCSPTRESLVKQLAFAMDEIDGFSCNCKREFFHVFCWFCSGLIALAIVSMYPLDTFLATIIFSFFRHHPKIATCA